MSQPEGSSPPFSLIKYEAEIQISANVEEYQKSQESQKQLDARPSPEDVLNNMILPRDWHTDNNQHFMQYVSHHKAERDDIIRLKEALDQALEHRQARTEGICPIREELFSQSFDEIVRQVTINSPERGLLLMRVRDQHKMTLAAYQTLYQSSVTFGMRKLLEAEQGMDELELLLAEAQQIKDTLENKKSELLSKKESLEKSILERKKEESEIREDQNLQIMEQEGFLAKFLAGIKEGTKQE